MILRKCPVTWRPRTKQRQPEWLHRSEKPTTSRQPTTCVTNSNAAPIWPRTCLPQLGQRVLPSALSKSTPPKRLHSIRTIRHRIHYQCNFWARIICKFKRKKQWIWLQENLPTPSMSELSASKMEIEARTEEIELGILLEENRRMVRKSYWSKNDLLIDCKIKIFQYLLRIHISF